MKLDAVFEGGGVKGIGLVGALYYAEEKLNAQWINLAGTSAGAVIAALLAAGYKAEEIKEIMFSLDFRQFKDNTFLSRFSIPGKMMSILFKNGIYKGDYIETLISRLLADKGVHTFGDLIITGNEDPRKKYKLNVIASDITKGKLLVLPSDITKYGMKPEKLSVARAVRMSMSIPVFYEPVTISTKTLPNMPDKCYVVDGGILSNYPVWLFDSRGIPEWPTVGFRLIEPEYNRPHKITNPLNFLLAIASTLQEAHDERFIQDSNFDRTISIKTYGIRSTDFDLTQEQRELLFESGYKAAESFFSTFTEQKYILNHPSFIRPTSFYEETK